MGHGSYYKMNGAQDDSAQQGYTEPGTTQANGMSSSMNHAAGAGSIKFILKFKRISIFVLLILCSLRMNIK